MTSRCMDCQAEFRGEGDLCPRCQRMEDQLYANEPRPVEDGEYQPWPWSKAGMRERLGVTGDVDE